MWGNSWRKGAFFWYAFFTIKKMHVNLILRKSRYTTKSSTTDLLQNREMEYIEHASFRNMFYGAFTQSVLRGVIRRRLG